MYYTTTYHSLFGNLQHYPTKYPVVKSETLSLKVFFKIPYQAFNLQLPSTVSIASWLKLRKSEENGSADYFLISQPNPMM